MKLSLRSRASLTWWDLANWFRHPVHAYATGIAIGVIGGALIATLVWEQVA